MIWFYAAIVIGVTGFFWWLTGQLFRGGEELSFGDLPEEVWEGEYQRMNAPIMRIHWITLIVCAICWFILIYGLALLRRTLLPDCDWMKVSSMWELFSATMLLDLSSMICIGDVICYSLYGGTYRVLGLPGSDDRVKSRIGTIAWVLFVLAVMGACWSVASADRYMCVGTAEFVDHDILSGTAATRYADIVELRTIEGILEADGRYEERASVEFARRDGTIWSSRESHWIWGKEQSALLEALKAKTGLPVKSYRTSPVD